jgi:hypothetical protein
VILERAAIVHQVNIAVVNQILCKPQFLTGALKMLYDKLQQLPVGLLKVMPLKRAVTTKVKVLDVRVVSMPEDLVAVEDLAVKIVAKADMLVDPVPAEDLEVPVVKIVAKVVKDLDSVVMRIAKQAFTTVAGLLALINLVQVKDLVKKALVKAHQEVVQAKIGGQAEGQLPNLARNSRKAS